MTNLVFDYDGTIHNTMKTYAPAFRNTCKWLSDNGYISPEEYSDSQISCWLGFNSTDMWSQFHPELNSEIREKARVMLGKDMAERVDNGEGALFEHAEEILSVLKNNGDNLIFLSNCRVHYMERHKRVFGLERFFNSFYDIETAVKNNLKSIGCGYGYGSPEELADADIVVDRITDIPDAVKSLKEKK